MRQKVHDDDSDITTVCIKNVGCRKDVIFMLQTFKVFIKLEIIDTLGLFSKQKCQTENAREDSQTETGNILFIVLSLVHSMKKVSVVDLTASGIQSEIENLMMIGTIQFDNQNTWYSILQINIKGNDENS